MAWSILHMCLLLTVYGSDGQSTSADPRCVYTFNVPTSDCAQTPGLSVDDQLLKGYVVALQEQFKQVVTDVRDLRERNDKLERDNKKLMSDNKKIMSDNKKRMSDVENLKNDSHTGTADQHSTSGGAVYIRWGRKTCPGNGTDLLYWGVAGGALFSVKGGGANYQCLPRDPQWGQHTDGLKSLATIHGAEYEMRIDNSPFLKTNFEGNLYDNDVPCAVCHVTGRQTKLMIPARKQCPGGWTREYHGYLTTSANIYHTTTFECMDEAPEVIEGAGRPTDGALFHTVEGDCSRALPCPNYVNGWALTCVVCTK